MALFPSPALAKTTWTNIAHILVQIGRVLGSVSAASMVPLQPPWSESRDTMSTTGRTPLNEPTVAPPLCNNPGC